MDPARGFLLEIDSKARTKVLYNIDKSRVTNDPKLFKKLTREIWEFRAKYNGMDYRLLAFWDKQGPEETIVISTHGFIKKTDKTPSAEIKKAEELRRTYFNIK